jgi:hypothetical protein
VSVPRTEAPDGQAHNHNAAAHYKSKRAEQHLFDRVWLLVEWWQGKPCLACQINTFGVISSICWAKQFEHEKSNSGHDLPPWSAEKTKSL